jgi:para-aminobenzoate synthetase component 1
MWSDKRPSHLRDRLAERLRSVLPIPLPPRPAADTPARVLSFPGDPGPERVVQALRGQPGLIWLDGGATGHRIYARPIVTLAARGGRATVSSAAASARFAAPAFDLLTAAFEAWGSAGPGLQLAGYLAYELGAELEALPAAPPADFPLPDLHFGLYDQVLVHGLEGWSIERALGWRPSASPFDLERAVAAGLAREPNRSSPRAPRAAQSALRSVPDGRGFRAAVERAVEWIGDGDIFQINLCRRLEAELRPRELWDLYLRLRAISPADHGAYLELGRGRAILSISPETFLQVRGRRVESHPIKGTRPRGSDGPADEAAVRELLASAKERAELTMIVDVTRNDLGRVCAAGSVEVPAHGELMTLPTVHHTVSRVRGTLRPGVGPIELLRATFPPASITGAPKIRAMERIVRMEPRRRGAAMGAIGWLALSGDLELSVAIRTAVAAGGRIAYHAGCGIVADSEAGSELAESAAKARAFLAALGSTEAE